ncbi:MAG: alpha/beta fold hydrolase [Polyangiales bacterium]
MRLRGHFWTLAPFLRDSLSPPRAPASTEWKTTCADPALGDVTLTGELSQSGESDTLVIVVHGLGGSATSYYAMRAARAVETAGLHSLRLNLRGADRRGGDYYHAGLTDDLAATLESPVLTAYARVLILAYSLGGNMTLRYLSGSPDPRVRAAVTICAPVDLARGARAIDRPHKTPYRRHVLRGLKEIYQEVASRGRVPLPIDRALRIDSIERWDEEVISPRHGFDGAEDYWAKTSAYSVLDDVRVPTLFIAEEQDPMVLIGDVRPWVEGRVNIRPLITNRGGHVGFPHKVDLGIGTRGTFEDQVIQWMLAPT